MDRRVKRTKAAVFNAMIALMIEKETDKITVLELCKKADINKSTFYLHFKSMGACIQFCFETITNGIVEIAKGINYDQIQRDPTDIINSMLNEIERNNNIERLTKFKNSRMCAPALRMLKQQMTEAICSHNNFTMEKNYHQVTNVIYAVGGCIDVILEPLPAFDREKLLPTIRSRVMELRFDPLSMEDTERVLETIRLQENDRPESLKDAELSQAEARWREQLPILARLAGGSAGKALEWFRLDALTLREEILDLVEQAGREDILVYADGLPWMLKNDRQESLVLMELLLLLFRDGLILETGLSQPLYNEDLRQRLAMCFAGWTEGMLRKGLELEEKCRRAIASFVTRRMAVEALALEIHQML